MKSLFRLTLLATAFVAASMAQAQSYTRPRPLAPAPAPAAAAEPRNPELETAGRLAAQGWLALLDRNDWGTAWDASSAVFRQTVPLGNWMDAIPKVRQPFGQLVEREPVDATYKTTLQGRPDGQYVSVVFRSKFRNQEVDEIVTTVRESDGRWRVTGYSPAPR
jgi:hypothetical protein